MPEKKDSDHGKAPGPSAPEGSCTFEELLEMAQLEGVKFVACKMTMDMMELTPADFIEGVEIQTAEDYIKHAKDCKLNMFT
jgi:peroxiredoxin family protein